MKATLAAACLAAALTFGGVMLLTGEDEPPAQPKTATVGTEGLAVFGRMGCGNCHRLAAANSSGQIGPALDRRLESHTAESLRAFILDPPPGMMPSDFGRRMSDEELDALVSFLLAARR